jgi:two-component system chemotaxis response regulator CheV
MPRMDGFHFASNIKKDERFKHIPILFNSSISGDFSQEKGVEAGGDGYLVKFDPKKFYEEVSRVLKK